MGYEDEEPEPIWCEEQPQQQPMGYHYEQQQPMGYGHNEQQEPIGYKTFYNANTKSFYKAAVERSVHQHPGGDVHSTIMFGTSDASDW